MTWEEERADACYECQGYGDDYYIDDDGNLVSACDGCFYNHSHDDSDDDWKINVWYNRLNRLSKY